MLQVHLVLDELDDGENQVGVAQPAEYIVEYRHVFVLHSPRDTVREGGEHHAGHLGEVLLHVARHVEGVVVGITGHTDHKVELCTPEGRCGFVDGRHLGERGRIAQSQFGVFIENLLVHAPVVFQHEGIVRVGDDQHVIDAACHQVHKRHVTQYEFVPLLWDVIFHKCFYCPCKSKKNHAKSQINLAFSTTFRIFDEDTFARQIK